MGNIGFAVSKIISQIQHINPTDNLHSQRLNLELQGFSKPST